MEVLPDTTHMHMHAHLHTQCDIHTHTLPRPSPSQLFQHHVGEISYKILRNADFREVNVEVGGTTVLRFAAAYGFRNIQVSLQ